MDEITGFSEEQAPASAPRARSRFVLTRQNQKGQVAIFVALIFQVIFVFFALLINVGLLVHHKINLQQSTDLAAYYGAMKQAEVMNAIAHVNFQIRQAWKLMTWRYRVLGTFGFMKADGIGPKQDYPFEFVGSNFVYRGSAMPQSGCTFASGETLGVQDIPHFCVSHAGFHSWPQGENLCRMNCNSFTGAVRINKIPSAGITNTPYGGDISDDVDNAVNQINNNLIDLCTKLKQVGGSQLARFASAYINEAQTRSATVEMLAKNLSLSADEIRDIEGKKILSGSVKTFENNLTEANKTGFKVASDFTALNGLSGQKCKFVDGKTSGTEFLKKIEFNFINYFIRNCVPDGGGFNYQPSAVYSETGGLSTAFAGVDPDLQNILLSFLNPDYYHTVGYEKNPYCVEYYAVKTSAEPNIPFLPLKKIKLSAVSIAKPFGGSIGPWYGKQWPKGNAASVANEMQQNTKMDENLPIKRVTDTMGLSSLPVTMNTQPNFSLYVGDQKGLRDPDYLAAFHSMLSIRDIQNYGAKSYMNNINPGSDQKNSGKWPDYNNWSGIDNASMADMRQYDSLASRDTDIGMRSIELAAIAPNQFDVTYYSIDPDFYNNYYRKLYAGFEDIKSATGGGTLNKNQLRPDFGAYRVDASSTTQPPPFDEKAFSVKDQILVKNTVLKTRPSNSVGAPSEFYSKLLNYLVSLQSSLLTGWTFLNFSDYTTFPGNPVDDLNNTMSFGQCNNEWNKTADAVGDVTDVANFRTPMDIESKYPPVPGNCVTGGRTGYSVKLVSPSLMRDTTKLENPIDEGFFSF